jgi:hypothetical protein
MAVKCFLANPKDDTAEDYFRQADFTLLNYVGSLERGIAQPMIDPTIGTASIGQVANLPTIVGGHFVTILMPVTCSPSFTTTVPCG